MTAARAWGVVDPVEHDECQAADHEDDAHHQENCRLGEKNYKQKTEQQGVDYKKKSGMENLRYFGCSEELTPIFCGECMGSDLTRRR